MNNINAVKPVVIFASNIEDNALLNPLKPLFLLFQVCSLILSNIRTLASTDIPIVNTIPAIPGQ